MTSPTGEVQLSQRFTPFGEVKEKFGDGEANFGYTAQKYDSQTGLLYLRARYYAPGTGRFISHDTWSGDANMPMSYNAWLYGYGNPVRYVDITGLYSIIAGIKIENEFTIEEQELIKDVIYDFANLLGGEDKIQKNLDLDEIIIDWWSGDGITKDGTYSGQYNSDTKIILLPYGWYSAMYTMTPTGKFIIYLGGTCLEEQFDFPEGSISGREQTAKWVLAHEMGHALAIGNDDIYKSFLEHVEIPKARSLEAYFNENPLIRRNAKRRLIQHEVFADAIASHLYAPTLLNFQMKMWLENNMRDSVK